MATTANIHPMSGADVARDQQHWDPTTRDLAAELPPLMKRLAVDGFQVHRVMLNPDDWDEMPRKIVVDGHTVKFGTFKTQDRHVITVVDGTTWTRIEVRDDSPDGS